MFRRYADDGAAVADLRRWLTAEGVRTRTGKERWNRSVIWGMLRDPAYAGTAGHARCKTSSRQILSRSAWNRRCGSALAAGKAHAAVK